MQSQINMPAQNLLPKEGRVLLFQNAINTDFASLVSDIQWKHEKIQIFGCKVLQPRLTAWYGDVGTEYSYSGLMNYPLRWTDSLIDIKKQVEEVLACEFNSVLCNFYRNGQDSMGWHQDNEIELGEDPVIASVSIGATRLFQMRHKIDKTQDRLKFELQNGSLLIMSGQTQQYWQHQVPKTKKDVGERINLTFRKIVNIKK